MKKISETICCTSLSNGKVRLLETDKETRYENLSVLVINRDKKRTEHVEGDGGKGKWKKVRGGGDAREEKEWGGGGEGDVEDKKKKGKRRILRK